MTSSTSASHSDHSAPGRRWLPPASPSAVRNTQPWLRTGEAYTGLMVCWAISGGYTLALAWADASWHLSTTSYVGILAAMFGLGLLAHRNNRNGYDLVGIFPDWPETNENKGRWRGQWWSTFTYATAALLAGIALYTVLYLLLPAHLTGHSVYEFTVREPFLHAVTVGATVVLLSAAGRPAWEVYTTSALMTTAVFAVPFGVASVAAAVPALCLVWLYRRTRRLSPLLFAEVPAVLIAVGLNYLTTSLLLGGGQ